MRVFLDTCILMSALQRAVVEGLAQKQIIEIYTSSSVLDEWAHVLTRKDMQNALGEILVFKTLSGVNLVEGEALGIWLKDENDIHVLEGAVSAHADILLTENIRDFPSAVCAAFGIEVMTLDNLLYALWLQNESDIRDIVEKALGDAPARSTLKRARLYRSAKLLGLR